MKLAISETSALSLAKHDPLGKSRKTESAARWLVQRDHNSRTSNGDWCGAMTSIGTTVDLNFAEEADAASFVVHDMTTYTQQA